MDLVAMEISGPVEPRLVVELLPVDHEGVPVPATDRMAHPRIDRTRFDLVHVDRPLRVRKLVDYHDLVRALDDLKRKRHVRCARHTGHVALRLRIERPPLVGVLFPLGGRPRLVRNGSALHDTKSRGYRKHRPELWRSRLRM